MSSLVGARLSRRFLAVKDDESIVLQRFVTLSLRLIVPLY